MSKSDLINNQMLTEVISEVVYKYVVEGESILEGEYSIPVEISRRHVHLTRAALDTLYGKNYQLTKVRDISQPGEFASEEKVIIISPKMKIIEGVRVVGPLREYTQIELAMTDAFLLGLDSIPTRLSGDIAGSQPITLVGPKGSLTLSEGAIRAARHVHMTPRDAEKYRVKNGDRVRIETRGRNGVIFKDVIVRVSEKSKLAFHIDTDEANAANIKGLTFSRILY